MKKVSVAIVGAGPFGLSVAAHLAARNIDHRIFGQPMQFWSHIADAGRGRYLKSYCSATSLSTPTSGFSFADYNVPRGLETFEPCSMRNFADYGKWFQQHNVPHVEPVDVEQISRHPQGFVVRLASGEQVAAKQVVVATGLSRFAHSPSALASLPPELAVHTSRISDFSLFKGRTVAVIGAGQSALEAAALLHEAGASPQLLVRDHEVLWQERIMRDRSTWRRLRSPISGLGTGPKSWVLTNFPDAIHGLPEGWRTRIVKTQFAAKGAWWLRERVENRVPIHLATSVVGASRVDGRVALELRSQQDGVRKLVVDQVVAGSGYIVNVDRLSFLDARLRAAIDRVELSPRLNSNFESSVPGLHFVGPASAMSFGPLFRFVVGAEYASRTVAAHLSGKQLRAAA